MMTVSSAVYASLLEHMATYQSNLTQGTQPEVSMVDVTRDDDDVCYWFGGAALCDMLKLSYKQIKLVQ